MKTIQISGKNNVDKLEKKQPERLVSQNWDQKDIFIDQSKHLTIINKLYLNTSFDGEDDVKREIENKINGYKNQDIKKDIYDESQLISYSQLVEKLVKSKLRCFYCKKQVKLMYNHKRDKSQWTLDRINNDLPHTDTNTVVADLKCNLERRCMDDKHFLWGKQLKITKLD